MRNLAKKKLKKIKGGCLRLRHWQRCAREPAAFAPCPWEWGSRAARAGWNWVQRVSGGWAECTAGSRRSCHRAAVAALSHHSLPQPSHAMRLTGLSLSLSVPQTARGERALRVCWAASASSASWEAFRLFRSFPPTQVILRKRLKKKKTFDVSRFVRENQENGWYKRKLIRFSVVLLAISLQIQYIQWIYYILKRK